jgi:hypothetical protein
MLEEMREKWFALENHLIRFIKATDPMVPVQALPGLPSQMTKYHKPHETKDLLIEAATIAQSLFRILIARTSFNILALQYRDKMRAAAQAAAVSQGNSTAQTQVQESRPEQEETPWEKEMDSMGFPYPLLDDFLNSACGDWDIRRRGGIVVAELATDHMMKIMSEIKWPVYFYWRRDFSYSSELAPSEASCNELRRKHDLLYKRFQYTSPFLLTPSPPVIVSPPAPSPPKPLPAAPSSTTYHAASATDARPHASASIAGLHVPAPRTDTHPPAPSSSNGTCATASAPPGVHHRVSTPAPAPAASAYPPPTTVVHPSTSLQVANPRFPTN